MNFSYTVFTDDIGKSAIDLIRSFWAPGVGPRKGEYFDKRYTDDEFDPDLWSDSVSDYIERWESKQWPCKVKFMNTLSMVCACYDTRPSPLFEQLKTILLRIYKEVFNEFKSTYYMTTRYKCLQSIYDDKVIKKLILLLAEEENVMIPLQLSPYKVTEQSDEEEEEEEDEDELED